MPKTAEKSTSKRGELTAKQKRFVEEYLIDLNATQAAIRPLTFKKVLPAGYPAPRVCGLADFDNFWGF